jgi:hypothetical protein
MNRHRGDAAAPTRYPEARPIARTGVVARQRVLFDSDMALRLLPAIVAALTLLAPAPALAKKKPPASKHCHPSYVGACLDPNASDYDCIGGSGNGPKYTGPVRVVGPDVFRLDADGDGWGCER